MRFDYRQISNSFSKSYLFFYFLWPAVHVQRWLWDCSAVRGKKWSHSTLHFSHFSQAAPTLQRETTPRSSLYRQLRSHLGILPSCLLKQLQPPFKRIRRELTGRAPGFKLPGDQNWLPNPLSPPSWLAYREVTLAPQSPKLVWAQLCCSVVEVTDAGDGCIESWIIEIQLIVWVGWRLSLPRVGDIASGVVVRGDLRLPRFDFPINTFPHWVSPQIRALCGLLRRIAISVAGGEIISHKAWEFWEAASGQSVLENLEAKSDFHNIMDKFFVLQSYRHIYDLSLLWGAFPHISGNLCSWLWYVPF